MGWMYIFGCYEGYNELAPSNVGTERKKNNNLNTGAEDFSVEYECAVKSAKADR